MSKVVRNKISLPGRNISKPITYMPLNISRPNKPMKVIYDSKPKPGDFIIGETELL